MCRTKCNQLIKFALICKIIPQSIPTVLSTVMICYALNIIHTHNIHTRKQLLLHTRNRTPDVACVEWAISLTGAINKVGRHRLH